MLKRYGYVMINHKDTIKVRRSSTVSLVMGIGSTYRTIYDICEKLVKTGLGYFSLILIQEICTDATKYKVIEKGLKKSGYVVNFKKLVENYDNKK